MTAASALRILFSFCSVAIETVLPFCFSVLGDPCSAPFFCCVATVNHRVIRWHRHCKCSCASEPWQRCVLGLATDFGDSHARFSMPMLFEGAADVWLLLRKGKAELGTAEIIAKQSASATKEHMLHLEAQTGCRISAYFRAHQQSPSLKLKQ